MTDTVELLTNLKNLTALTGKLSDLHKKNLEFYPYIFFNAVKTVKIEYNLAHHHDILEDQEKITLNKPIVNHFVAYYLELDESNNNELDKRYSALSKAVKTLFWDDVKVEIYLNNNIKFKG